MQVRARRDRTRWRVGLALVAMCAAVGVGLAADEPIPGALTERVCCARDPEHSYALYLPPDYTAERGWPVIYCFSPGGNGAVPVRLLMPAAEVYGYILVGSHDVRNGPWEPTLEAQRALWREVNHRFAVDPKRSYATGFSGGSRAAVELALAHRKRFAGLILCGAMFSPRSDFPKGGGLAIIGLVGDGDLNYEEHLRSLEVLDDLGYDAHWQEVFEGAHQWPDADLYREAVELLEIDAMRRSLAPADNGFIARIAADRLAGGEALVAAGRPVLALRRFRQTAEHFAGTSAGASARERAAELETDAGVRRLLETEEEILADLRLLNDWRDYSGFRRGASSMRRRAANPGRIGERARLMLHLCSIQLSRVGTGLLQQGKVDEALPTLHIAATVYPPNAIASYNAACAFALTGEGDMAVRFLDAAARHGFANADLAATDPDLDSIRSRAEVAPILERMQTNREAGVEPPAYDFAPREPAS